MHKFFCNYNNLTEKYELSLSRGNLFSTRATVQAEGTLLPQIKNDLQGLYENIVLIKESEKDESRLNRLDETELMVSNLYYSLFASPMELAQNKSIQNSQALSNALELVNQLERNINIPEYNRLVGLIKNNLLMLQVKSTTNSSIFYSDDD